MALNEWKQHDSAGNYITMRFKIYSSPNIIMTIESRRTKWAKHVARIEETPKSGSEDLQRPAGGTRKTWENNIKMYLT